MDPEILHGKDQMLNGLWIEASECSLKVVRMQEAEEQFKISKQW